MRNFSKLNTLFKSANTLEALLKNVLFCDPMHDCLRKVSKILAEINEVSHLCFGKKLIETLYVPIVI